jgi:hypothetical protein
MSSQGSTIAGVATFLSVKPSFTEAGRLSEAYDMG